MRIFHIASVLSLLFLLTANKTEAQLQSAVNEDSVYYLKLANGVNAVLRPIPTHGNTELTLVISAGSMFENDSMNGVAHVLERYISSEINNRLLQSTGILTSQNTFLESYSNTDRSAFKLTVSAENTEPALMFLIKHVLHPELEENSLVPIINSIMKEFEQDTLDPRKLFADKMIKCLYRTEYESMNSKGSVAEVKKIELTDVIRYFKKYYVPNNAILVGTGNFNYPTLRGQFEKLFDPLIRSEFDPELITKITDFKPILYTTQFIVEDSTAVPEFKICWQFPGASSNRQVSYCAVLLTTILNDKNNFLQIKAKKLGCRKLVFEYDIANYSGVFRAIIQPDTANFSAVYQLVMKELLRLEKTLVNESMMNAAKIQFRKDFEAAKNTKEFAEKVVKYWVYKDDSYFRDIGDSVMTVQEKRLKNFVIEYINQNAHVGGLLISKKDREALKADSVFADVNESVGNYTFRYLQNITDVEGAENLAMQQNLLQWLLINPDVNVQVNGYSDEGEFNKARDASIMQFIDSLPTFRKATSDKMEKGYLPPEMMRALKIVKYLYENGITADRLSGTAMKFSSDNDEEAIDNAKCTVTIKKLHKNMPLREYHYKKQ